MFGGESIILFGGESIILFGGESIILLRSEGGILVELRRAVVILVIYRSINRTLFVLGCASGFLNFLLNIAIILFVVIGTRLILRFIGSARGVLLLIRNANRTIFV